MRVLPKLLSLALFFALAPGPRAQEKKGIQIKVESRLVLVDLVVTDSDGGFAGDLRADEVQIFEDGRRRELVSFEKRQAGPRPIDEKSAAGAVPGPEAVPRASGAPQVGERGSTLVFLIDLPSIEPKHLPQVKQTIAEFARSRTGPDDTLMLVTAGRGARTYQPPTRDVEKFQRALDGVSAAEDHSSLLRFGQDLDNLLRAVRETDMPREWATRNAYNLGREYLQREEHIAQASFESAAALVKEIGTLPGRKHILFFSSGYRLKIGPAVEDALLLALRKAPDPLPGRSAPRGGADAPAVADSSSLQIRSQLGTMMNMERLQSFLRRLVDEANRSQVSFYTVDARALMTNMDIRFRTSAPYSDQLMREEINQPQDFLRDLASATGGRSFLNSNDLGRGIRSAWLDLAQHYELGYVPEQAATPGTLHTITVKVLRPGVQLSHRRSFVEPGPFDAEQRIVENAFKFTELSRDFPIEADTSFRSKKLKVDVFVPARFLSLTPSDDRYRCDLTVYVAIFDAEGKLFRNRIWFSKTYKLDYSSADRARLEKVDNLTSSCQGEVPPGNYRLKVVVRQSPASKTAALEKQVAVPE